MRGKWRRGPPKVKDTPAVVSEMPKCIHCLRWGSSRAYCFSLAKKLPKIEEHQPRECSYFAKRRSDHNTLNPRLKTINEVRAVAGLPPLQGPLGFKL